MSEGPADAATVNLRQLLYAAGSQIFLSLKDHLATSGNIQQPTTLLPAYRRAIENAREDGHICADKTKI